MDKQELLLAFSNMDINDKRDCYNEEILKMFELLKLYFDDSRDYDLSIDNYNFNKDFLLNEDEYLTKEFKNILTIQEFIIYSISAKK